MKKHYLLTVFILCSFLFSAQNPGNSLHFNGGANHVTAALPAVFDDIPNNDITVEGHVVYTGPGFTRVFFAQKDQNNYFTISMTNFGGQVELYVYVSASGIVNSVRTSAGLQLGQNHHIAARWTASTATVEIFVDGQLAGTTFGGDTSTGVNNMMTIGSRTDGSQAFNGEIDELAIWSEARILCLIVQDANEGITVGDPNLVAYYTFNQGVAGANNTAITTLTDATGNFNGTLQNFVLNGMTSNFVDSNAFSFMITGPVTFPTALCKAPFTIQLDANGEASITVNDIDDGSFDLCGYASIVIDKTDFTCADIGNNIVTLTITDLNGNTASCTTVVTVEEVIAPDAICVAPFTIQLDVNGLATITPEMIDNFSTDNCAIDSLSIDITEFTCADIGDNTITLTVTDTSGNTATCTTVVTVENTLDPVAVCVAPFTIQLDANGEATITPAAIDGGSTASCGAVTLSLDVTNFTCADIGDNTVTLTVTDGNGNSSTCTTVVTVEDNVAPEALCVAPFTIQLDANGQASITAAMIDNGSNDACGIDTISISQTDFDCTHIGDNTITLTVTDINGNTSTCTTVITVEDNVAPEALCVAPFTIQLDANGQATITAAMIDNASSDACGIDTISISQTDFDCTHIGANTITLTVTDVNGNTSTCTTVVTVEDNVAPEALCVAPFTIQLDANGQASITAAMINDGSSDACGIDTISISQTDFDCTHVGANTITLTVTDINGNTSTCTTVVNVEDNVAPEALCVAPFTIQLDANGQASITATMINDGSSDACGIDTISISQTDFDCTHVGANTITLTITDINGNTSTCTTVVTVEDNIAPEALCVAPFTIQLNANGQASITAAMINDGSNDICGIDTITISQTDFDCTHLGANTITLTVTDVNGNTSTCTTVVTVEDNVAPEALCVAPFTIQLDANGQATITAAMIDNASNDACGIDTISISQTNFDCTHIGANTITLTITDVNGNTSTCTTVVTVEDNVAPEALCVAPFTIQLDANGQATITTAMINNGSSDACGIDTISISQTDFDCTHVGANTITLTVTDINGNTSTCTTVVTVEDNVAPEALCVAPFTIQLDANGQASITAAMINDGSSDICGIDTISISQTDFDCTHLGANTITLTVTDLSGNVSTCTTVVTVEDNVAPEALCVAPITIILDGNGQGTITPAMINNGSSDACGIDTITISQTDFDCTHLGDNIITLTITDLNGNTSTCTTVATVKDSFSPEALCVAPFTIQLDANGEATITPSMIDNGSSDACGIASISISQTDFDCSHLGNNTITLTVIDVNGNQSKCTTVVTVEDNVAPEALCVAPITIQLDANGQATITSAMINNGSTDNCSIDTISISQTDFDCTHLGNNTVTLTVTDVNGNVSTCTTVVIVESENAPVVTCLDITLDLDANGTAVLTPAEIGSYLSDCQILVTAIDIDTFNCSDVGTPILVTYTATDGYNNLSCTAWVTLVDNIAPVIKCPNDMKVDADPGSLGFTVPDYFADGIVSITDNCTTPVTIFTQTPAPGTMLVDDGIYTITLTATDASGNTSTCSFELIMDTVLGTDDHSNIGSLTLYPNPASQYVTLSNPNGLTIDNVAVYDIQGRLVIENKTRTSVNHTLDVSSLSAAVYMVLIEAEGKQLAKRLIVNR